MALTNQINFRVEDDLLDEIKAEAKSTKSTPSQIIRLAVDRYLKGLKHKVTQFPSSYSSEWPTETR